MDGFGGVLGLEEEELGHHHVGRVVGDGSVDAYDSLLEEAREYVVGSLSSRRVLYHHWYQAVRPSEIARLPADSSAAELADDAAGDEAPHGCFSVAERERESRGREVLFEFVRVYDLYDFSQESR